MQFITFWNWSSSTWNKNVSWILIKYLYCLMDVLLSISKKKSFLWIPVWHLRNLESKWRKHSMDRDMERMGVKVRGAIKARAARTVKSLVQQNIFINPAWHWRKKKSIQMAPAITIDENWFGLTGKVSPNSGWRENTSFTTIINGDKAESKILHLYLG